MAPRDQKKRRRPDNKGRVQQQPFSDEVAQIWDRQPGEGETAWKAFQLYRDAEQEGGIGKRLQRSVSARVYPGSPEGPRAKNTIADWSVKFGWIERCEAYDRHLDQVRQEEFRREAKRDAIAALSLLRAMRAKAGHAIIAMQAASISPSEATRMADIAIVGIRREAGLATEITSTERDNAFAEWITRGGDPDDEDEEGEQHEPEGSDAGS